MAIYNNAITNPNQAHTLSEFISIGKTSTAKLSYRDISYIENRDNMEFVVKNTLSDFIYELKQMSIKVALTDEEIRKYRYNPKMLSFDLYGTTRLYYVILLMNDLCDIHKFDLKNNNLLLLTKSQMANSISKIYKTDSFSIATFNNNHKNDAIITPIIKFR